MTDVIDRLEDELPRGGVVEDHVRAWSSEVQTGQPAETTGVTPLGVLAAVVAGATAVVTLVVAGSHVVSRGPSVGLLLVAIGQGLAVAALVIRPTRRRLWAIGAADLAAVVTWMLLAGAHPGPGGLTAGIGLTLSLVGGVLCLLLAVAPRAGSRWGSPVLVIGSVLPVGIVAVTGIAVMSLPATQRASAPRTVNPLSSASAAARDIQRFSVPVPGQNNRNFLREAQGNDSETSELKPYQPLDPATQQLLNQQLLEAQQAALRYPTVADAKRAGMILAGGMAPGVGAHYQLMSASTLQGVNADGSINAAHPASWIYASTADNAPVVGVMYVSMTINPPSGFAGPNDHWHQHSNVCVQYTDGKITVPFAADSSVTPQECANVHGFFMKRTVWMVHAWVIPGWQSPQGVFSHANLHLYCPGNTDLVDPIGLCQRQQ
jgi:hypothetical protein